MENHDLTTFAIWLHDHFCHYSHADECGWHYEIKKGEHQWNDASHARWLASARNLLKENNLSFMPLHPAGVPI